MLSGKGNEKGERTTMGLISKKATLHVQRTFLYIFLPLFCTTTIWNFQKLPSYTFYGGNVVRVLAVPDTDHEIRDWRQSSKPLEKGGGWGRSPKNSKQFFSALRALVSLAAIFSIVTQRSSPQALRDDTKNGCEGDYSGLSLV